jgi:hypothetical protein
MKDVNPVTPHEARFIAAAIAHETQEEAAASLRCHVRTYQRTIARPHVQAALALEATRRLRRMTVVLARHAEAALHSLGRMASGALPATSARVRACIAVAELGTKAIEIEDYGARLDAIEGELARRKSTGELQ